MKHQLLLLLATSILLAAFFSLEHGFESQAALSEIVGPTPSPTPSPAEPEIVIGIGPRRLYEYPKELKAEDILNMSFGTNDLDCDGVENNVDNCVSAYNPKQSDKDKDGEGDKCDADTGGDPYLRDWRCDIDGDGRLDRDDNCILVCNRKQEDKNKDGIGDACDEKNFQRIDFCPKRAKSSDRKAGGY